MVVSVGSLLGRVVVVVVVVRGGGIVMVLVFMIGTVVAVALAGRGLKRMML